MSLTIDGTCGLSLPRILSMSYQIMVRLSNCEPWQQMWVMKQDRLKHKLACCGTFVQNNGHMLCASLYWRGWKEALPRKSCDSMGGVSYGFVPLLAHFCVFTFFTVKTGDSISPWGHCSSCLQCFLTVSACPCACSTVHLCRRTAQPSVHIFLHSAIDNSVSGWH